MPACWFLLKSTCFGPRPALSGNSGEKASLLPELLECHLVSGNFDYLLKARVRDMQEYRSLLGEKILALPGV